MHNSHSCIVIIIKASSQIMSKKSLHAYLLFYNYNYTLVLQTLSAYNDNTLRAIVIPNGNFTQYTVKNDVLK